VEEHLSLAAIATPFLAVMAAAAFCYFARPILVPLVTALTLAYVLSPVVDFLSRKLPRSISVLLVVGVAASLLVGLGFLLIQQGRELAGDVPVYLQDLKTRLGEPEGWPRHFPEPLSGMIRNALPELKEQLGAVDVAAVTGRLFVGLGSVLGFLAWSALVALLAIFILLDMPHMQQQLLRLMGPRNEPAMKAALDDIDRQLRTFLTVKIGISGALGVVATIGLVLLGVPYAWVWGPLAGVMNIVPYVGSLISSVPPVLMVAIERQSLAPALWVAAFLVLIQQIEGNVVTPKLMGDRIQLNVVAVLVASMVWGWLWGALGILLAIPITAAVKVVCDRVEPLRPIAVLLG
jgi:predicted PurR-regulated permease PerM